MIIIRYKGGLGNQMFQYAMQLALERCYGKEHVFADISHYLLHHEHNGFELEKVWGLSVKTADKKTIQKISPYLYPGSFTLNLPQGVQEWIRDNGQYRYKKMRLKKCTFVREHYYRQKSHCSYEEDIFGLQPEENWYIDGLWQNVTYFKDVIEDIKAGFQYQRLSFAGAETALIRRMQVQNSVSVHVRRGDFINSKFDICNDTYYQEALSLLKQKLYRGGDTREVFFYFFTDEPDYVKDKFQAIKNKEIVSHGEANSILDMELMSACRHHIVSNSTFSWWSAFLDDQREITIAPKYSIKKSDGVYPLSAPDDWILLEV